MWAPPCVGPWRAKSDNGGATAQRVTKNSIKVVYAEASGSAEGQLMDCGDEKASDPSVPVTSPSPWTATKNAWREGKRLRGAIQPTFKGTGRSSTRIVVSSVAERARVRTI